MFGHTSHVFFNVIFKCILQEYLYMSGYMVFQSHKILYPWKNNYLNFDIYGVTRQMQNVVSIYIFKKFEFHAFLLQHN